MSRQHVPGWSCRRWAGYGAAAFSFAAVLGAAGWPDATGAQRAGRLTGSETARA